MPADSANRPVPPIFLGRQPILDRHQQLYAYKLLFRDGRAATGNRAAIDDPTQATATVIANAFAELATHDALGRRRCFISIDHELLFSELVEALPAPLVTLEIHLPPAPDAGASGPEDNAAAGAGTEIEAAEAEQLAARCRQLRARGLTLALDGSRLAPAYRQLLGEVDVVKLTVGKDVDAGDDDPALRARVAELRPLARTLLAEKVETRAQFDLCQQLGFDLFQGYYFAQPTLIVGQKLNPSQLSLLRLLALVVEDAETSQIERAFKLEPGLTVNLLRLTNSVSSGLAMKITSLRHAITVLGRRQLQRWLQLLAYTSPRQAATGSNPLLQLAATRGRLMELLVERLYGRNRELCDQAFLVGIISLMPALLGTTMHELLERLPVAPRVSQALLAYGGAHGQLLHLVEATESADPQALEAALRQHPTLGSDFLDASLAQALAWANGLDDEHGGTP